MHERLGDGVVIYIIEQRKRELERKRSRKGNMTGDQVIINHGSKPKHSSK